MQTASHARESPPLEPHPVSTLNPGPVPLRDEEKQIPSRTEDCTQLPPSNGLLESTASHPGPRRGRFWLRQMTHRFWILEACASVFSLSIFVTILGVLVHYDNAFYDSVLNAQQSTKNRPTIFPLLSFLSAVMRAAMLLPVATAIGQLKWSWFRATRGQRLLDMERFDEAARGILGSAKLMWTMRLRGLAVVGAALTILALPLDALIQSAVSIPARLVVNDVPYSYYNTSLTSNTTMPRITRYNEWQIMTSADRPWPETALINAIRFGESYGNGLDDVIDAVTHVDCPTKYCKFPKAQTLDIGFQCVDRTGDVQTISDDENSPYPYQTLPGTNLTLFYQGNDTYLRQILKAESYAEYPDENYEQDVFGASRGPLIVRTAMLLDFHGKSTLAVECALYWSIRTSEDYMDASSNFELNATYDDINFAWLAPDVNSTDNLWELTPKKCFVQGEEIQANETDYYRDQCVYKVGYEAGTALQNLLTDPQDGFIGDSWLKDIDENNNGEWTRMNNFEMNIYEAGYNSTPSDAMDSYDTMWQNIAFTTSFTVRRAGSFLEDNTTAYLDTTGTIYRPISVYHIHWVRLTMPALIIVCSALFVLYTAWLTRKEYAWRRSTLPLLFHGLEDRERAALGDVRDFIVMQQVAANMHVKLEEHVDANGARFTTQQ